MKKAELATDGRTETLFTKTTDALFWLLGRLVGVSTDAPNPREVIGNLTVAFALTADGKMKAGAIWIPTDDRSNHFVPNDACPAINDGELEIRVFPVCDRDEQELQALFDAVRQMCDCLDAGKNAATMAQRIF